MKKQNIKILPDKAFVRLIATSVIGILICIACLCSSTYAWFFESIESPGTTLEAASDCQLSVAILGGEEDSLIDENIKYGESITLNLKKDVEYTVTLSLPRDSSSGYCIMSAGGEKYYSPFIQRHNEDTSSEVFTLRVLEDTSVTFLTHWGIYSGECSVKNGELIIG